MDLLPIRRALVSVTDKTSLVDLCAFLHQGGVELVSTGGTRKALFDAGMPVVSVSDVTGCPEILGGRVKTLPPHIHAAVLADKDAPVHMATLKGLGITPFDLVCVNLYDFARAAARGLALRQAVEEIDIGGPTLLRGAAKNFHSVAVVPGPEHYPALISELTSNAFRLGLDFRRRLAATAFEQVSRYDSLVAGYLASGAAS
ncbi:MAG: IMP cyclohydrolase [Desulfohalobiaceae bacterium]